MAWDDPISQLIIPVRTENVTLTLENVPLQQALLDLTTASGYVVAAGADLQGVVSLKAENKPINEVLDQIAAAANAKWRPIYLLSVPRQLSQEEQDARQEQRFQSGWASFWAKAPADRAKDIQQRVDGINRMADRMKENPQMAQRFQRRGGRMMQRMVRYSATLSDSQRAEIKPLLQAMGRAMSGQ